MNTILTFLTQLLITAGLCLALMAYLRPHLKRVLVDLCGTEERAQFWTVFANIMLVALPVIVGLGYAPEFVSLDAAFFEVIGQIKWNLFGFIFSLMCVGLAVGFFAMIAPRPAKNGQETK